VLDISLDEVDTNPFAFNLRNCTLFFRLEKREERPENAPSGWRARERWVVERREHDAADMISRMADIDYEPNAECPEWVSRLETIQPEADQRALFQQIHGYSLLGVRDEQKFVLSQGRGGDGKSLTYAVIAEMMGSYYAHADVQTFLAGARKSGSDHSSDLARLSGDIRLVTCDEPEKFSTFNTKIIKQVTGGGKITARALREAEIEFVPQWLLIMECNPMPRVPTSDDGFWRRALLFQWPIQFKGLGMRPEPFTVLKSRLLAERSGILNWMIDGALKWLSQRELPTTKRSEEVKDEYRRSSDPFGEWYLDRVVTTDASVRTLAKDLYADFKHFCEEQGMEKVPTPTAFGNNLAERQHKRKKSGGVIWREGIKLKDSSVTDDLGAFEGRARQDDYDNSDLDDDPFS
jgi:putative DNA primase/helicase